MVPTSMSLKCWKTPSHVKWIASLGSYKSQVYIVAIEDTFSFVIFFFHVRSCKHQQVHPKAHAIVVVLSIQKPCKD